MAALREFVTSLTADPCNDDAAKKIKRRIATALYNRTGDLKYTQVRVDRTNGRGGYLVVFLDPHEGWKTAAWYGPSNTPFIERHMMAW